MTSPAYWEEAKAHLSASDPEMARIIADCRGEFLRSRADAYLTLARAIVGQQISVKAADAVWKKLEAGFGILSPFPVIEASEEALRACGLSRQKTIYMKDLSHYFYDNPDISAQWTEMDDEAIIKSLTSIKGIGRWTAEMFLIFFLVRPDVFPVDDLGLQKAMNLLYFNNEKQTPATYRNFSEAWKPYRSAATWYLWRSLDPVPVEY